MRGVNTTAVTAGRPEEREGQPLNHGITLASNFFGSNYSRCQGTDNTRALEAAVAALEGALHGTSFASGMAACAAVFEAVAPRTVVLPLVCYVGMRELVDEQEGRGYLAVRRVDATDAAAVEAAMQALPRPDLVWLESPSNPLLQTANLELLCRRAAELGIVSCVDATFATPVNHIKPIALGATMVMHSATKYIGGHSDLLMGVVVCNDARMREKLVEARSVSGGVPGALESFLALRGLRTLPLRFQQHCKNAAEIAERLKGHAAVARVHFPGWGGMVSFEVAGGAAAADAVCAATRLVARATSLGGVESSMERRAKYTGEAHIAAGLIRMSVGIEDVADIWADLEQALESGRRMAQRVFIPKEKSNATLRAIEAAVEVESGAVVAFETNDFNYEKLSRGEHIDIETVNVVTGPLRVANCRAGDTLRVDVLEVRIRRCWSVWDADAKMCGCLAAKRAAAFGTASIRELPICHEAQQVQVSERLRVSLRPMIGVIATASSDAAASSTFEPTYCNGGNMDLRQMEAGSSVLLPVLVDGGLLYIGDLHAAMGEGEPTWVGFEAAGTATVRVTVIRDTPPPPYPRLVVGDTTVFTAVHGQPPAPGSSSQPYAAAEGVSPHDAAMQDALGQAYDHLLSQERLTPEEAFGFLTALGDARFGGPASRQALVAVPSPKPYLQK